MSGGYYDYQYSRLIALKEDIEYDLSEDDIIKELREYTDLSKQDELELINKAKILIKDIEI